MATVPLLDLCLKDCTLLRGRKFSVEKDQGLSGALHTAMQMGIPIYVLFPGPEASDLADMYLLIAIDGTWRQGKEMYRMLMPLLKDFAPIVVHLPLDSIPHANWDCALKREPALGCTTTAEAVARAVGILEGSNDVRDALMAPLRHMTALQAQFDPATHARIECGNESLSRSKRNFGFKMPRALILFGDLLSKLHSLRILAKELRLQGGKSCQADLWYGHCLDGN
ncbi:hypothetical protein WJX75_000413 [Coccomyxa subellipsoidea]|uniref:tRNA-uridine aminocarboxypropyltransferase n=1 Tax=Coccomyxa subellipsoidea TaxID=248742 RepID=A0ABR2YG80_9CHLO